MLRMLFVTAVLVVLIQAPVVLSRPPEGPSGRMVQDQAAMLKAEVQRLEKAAKSEPGYEVDLTIARAQLAAAEGKIGKARTALRKLVAEYEERETRYIALTRAGAGTDCGPHALLQVRAATAYVRCALADVEGDRVVLARELPKVIACQETMLAWYDSLRKEGVYGPEETDDERAMRKELRQVQKRLDAVKRK